MGNLLLCSGAAELAVRRGAAWWCRARSRMRSAVADLAAARARASQVAPTFLPLAARAVQSRDGMSPSDSFG